MEGPSNAAAPDDKASIQDDTTSERKIADMSSDDHARSIRFMDALTGTTDNMGILRKKRKSGPAHLALVHQRKGVKFMLPNEQKRSLLCHDPGLGKTYTLMLLMAALWVVHRGSKSELKFLISVPASCIEQWYREVTETLKIAPKLILRTNRLCNLTKEAIASHAVIIVSRDTIGRAYSSCYEYVQAHHLNQQNRWVSQWDRIANTNLHPLFETNFSLFGIDELHMMRNPLTAWTKGHELISTKATKSVGLTATPVFNSPKDLVGISTALDLRETFKTASEWFVDKEKTRVNTTTIKRFNGDYVHRADDSILNLPPIDHEYVNFDVSMPPESVADYNETLTRARRIRFTMERNNRATRDEFKKLMSYLQTMQQFLVSPILADKGAIELKSDPELVERAAAEDTGSLKALRNTILNLKERGFKRVMVAACHTSLLKIANASLTNNCPECGDIITYDGSLSQSKRTKAIAAFLGGENTVMLMSIDAGGTGLHLVPGANAVVFWGSRPFSPMQVLQTAKRVHRLGQEFPCLIIHLIANGSVDHAINLVHGDKLTLSNAVIDMDMDSLEAEGGKWRTTGRIVDGCKFMSEDGIFPEEDITEEEVIRMAQARAAAAQPNSFSGIDLASMVQNALNPDTGMPPLPPSIAQALLANAANLSTGALGAVGLQI